MPEHMCSLKQSLSTVAQQFIETAKSEGGGEKGIDQKRERERSR